MTADWVPETGKSVEHRAAVYADLRQRCPIPRADDGWGGSEFWALMRYDDIAAAVAQPEAFANAASVRLGIRRVPLESDPPEHGQIRRLLMPLFAPRAMAEREPMTRAIAVECLEALLGEGGGDAVKLVTRPFPTQVLLTWLGQPREDWARVKAWADASRPQRVRDAAHGQAIKTAEAALWDYAWAMVRDRQALPRDPASDPVTAMLNGQVDGAPIGEEMAVGMVRLAVAAGHDSTTQAVGICIRYLATHPDAQAMLRADPSRLRMAIEEILRVETPIVAMPRTVKQPVDLAGHHFEPGQRVMLYWASANRDPAAFEAPDECQLDRFPNRHMVFGSGIHLCAGAPLARLELRVVLEELLARTTAFGMAGEPTIQDMHQYGFTSLPVWVK
jgi:cytochrome P450